MTGLPAAFQRRDEVIHKIARPRIGVRLKDDVYRALRDRLRRLNGRRDLPADDGRSPK